MSQTRRVAFVSLGCAKALVDSEKMLGLLAEAGCELTADETDAEVVVVNTCGFLSAGREEAVETINELAELKRTARLQRIVVAGCLVQRDGEDLRQRAPEIDALVGVNNRADVVRAVLGDQEPAGGGRRKVDLYLGDYYPHADDDTARLRITPPHYAYLRLSEGCDQKCTFCTIPSIRGPMHCKSPDAIVAEARELAGDGAVEINLIGQDTTSYGKDIGYEPGLAGLLRRLNAEVADARWLRLMYAYPTELTHEIIDAVSEAERVANYIDMPLQHINDRILKAMHRRVDRQATEELLCRLRDRIPGVTIRTTMIVGFPGETDAEFEELVEFVRSFRFDALGVFPYSQEPDTPAGRMKGRLPDDVMSERVDVLMKAQQQVAFGLADDRVGERFDVLVEGEVEPGVHQARHAGQAPEVDSVTLVEGNGKLDAGSFVRVRCSGRRDYDLLAKPIQRALPVVG